ncbi:hypothetical protein BKP64_05675 [Marinobacter salinus]|uniref:AAA+ ATPase domain-containing protein n=1 Tax=Marinobacter salinus TaxID=1874317 RepID=A0A1D9GJY0_9GAMM|nr:hypothetical protein [Marinobacter salinus]AOY87700.1 hypothetical protein BKP64_05675 [Marinobacter salinus]
MQTDLTQEQQLKNILDGISPFDRNPVWLSSLAEFLEYVGNADLETRKTREFQQKLWEDNQVSGVGMGTVNITAALDDPDFRSWIAEASMKPLPESHEARIAQLQSFHDQMAAWLKKYTKRIAWVKICRVMAALYPQHFSTITYDLMAQECHRAWFGDSARRPKVVSCQNDLMRRLEDLLGPVKNTPTALADRMTLPWFVYESHVQGSRMETVAEVANDQGEVKLKPLPALQRRKGLSSIRGGMATLIKGLSFVEDGVRRDELIDFLRSEFPDYRENSLRTLVNVLKNEFYVIQENDGIFTKTTRGELYLETEDPQELVPIFLTRVLGIDHVLLALKERDRTSRELYSLLQKVNSGWTSDFMPGSLIKWLKDFELIQNSDSGLFSLSESGQEWTEQIHWTPEFLKPADLGEGADAPDIEADFLNISSVDEVALINEVTASTAFASRLVSQLHFGLWSHERRHLAILAGLSGSGKTLLAQRYGQALTEQFNLPADKHVFVQAVQPGWYDASPLFGHINPLRPDNYVRSPLLDFLLQAASRPNEPFIVILDEMNLSHPEQYFAPVLSAMETGDHLRLHNEGKSFDGVPNTIPYPSNVAFIGTVNMDETTHGISDKVLDRAFTMEFWEINLENYPNWQNFGLNVRDLSRVKDCLTDLLSALETERMHFGWRTVEDVLSYMALAQKMPDIEVANALDDVIYARVLPKLRGSESQRLHEALLQVIKVLTEYDLKRCRAKVETLKRDLSDTGMMRFWR